MFSRKWPTAILAAMLALAACGSPAHQHPVPTGGATVSPSTLTDPYAIYGPGEADLNPRVLGGPVPSALPEPGQQWSLEHSLEMLRIIASVEPHRSPIRWAVLGPNQKVNCSFTETVEGSQSAKIVYCKGYNAVLFREGAGFTTVKWQSLVLHLRTALSAFMEGADDEWPPRINECRLGRTLQRLTKAKYMTKKDFEQEVVPLLHPTTHKNVRGGYKHPEGKCYA